MDPIAGLAEDPLAKLLVGVGEVAKLAQEREAALEEFHARLDATFLFRVSQRRRGDGEAVSLGEVGGGPTRPPGRPHKLR